MTQDNATLFIVLVKAWLEHRGKYLLARRAPSELQAPNAWALPGGKVEPHEGPGALARTLREEVREEVGLDLEGDDLRLVYDNCFRRVDGQFVVGMTFHCRVKDSAARPLDETTEVAWFSVPELQNLGGIEPWLQREIEQLERFLGAGNL